MANVATSVIYRPYGGSVPSATTTTTTLTAPSIPLDQVDNNTTRSLNIKQFIVNRMNEKYCSEDERLKTFENWPNSWLDTQELARTGMFFTNEEDKVKCYFCEVEIGRWETTDRPVPEHLRWSPNCPLLRRRHTNNRPINEEALDRILPPISYDICGSNDLSVDVRENAYSEGRQSMMSMGVDNMPLQGLSAVESSTAMPQPCSHAGPNNGVGNYFPEYPEYAIESARLRSFEDWPRNMKQKPQQLAEAGFFYTGVGDRVRCFSCGGGLKDWDDNDEPWEQHAVWLSQCRFVKLIKGQLFIDNVAAKNAKSDDQKHSQDSNSLSQSADAQNGACESAPATVLTAAAAATAAATVTSATAAAAVTEGDVAPTAATRIYEKIVAQGCPEGVVLASSAAGAACGATVPEEKLCKICYAAEYNTAFLPCGHVVACAKCASSVTKCPLCRKSFTDVMRVYFS